MKINFWFVGWIVVFILNFIVGIMDYLQSGIAWPVNFVAILMMVVLRFIKYD